MGRDRTSYRITVPQDRFYSHALVGRDDRGRDAPKLCCVSTHTPSWGVTAVLLVREQQYLGFYSHALVGRDWLEGQRGMAEVVSTHTPSWGVTALGKWEKTKKGVSTHTPSWGVTIPKGELETEYAFLLTRPRGA